jgi:hypothetical protein
MTTDRGNNNTARKAMGEGSEQREIRLDRKKDDLDTAMHQDCHRGMSSGCNRVSRKPGSDHISWDKS